MSTVATRGSTPRSKNVTTGKQRKRGSYASPDRLDRLWALHTPVVRPPWESAHWWADRANRYQPRDCGKNATHGPARLRYQTGFTGRSLAWSCQVCGWDQAVLVQEGAQEPCPPDHTPPRKSNVEIAYERRTPEAKRAGGLAAAQLARERAKRPENRAPLEQAIRVIEAALAEFDNRVDMSILKLRMRAIGASRLTQEKAREEVGMTCRKVKMTWIGSR